ncbi:mechanosensitive ion channel protein MscS [Sediminicola sp. YIK13]|uniref:mechanosensitive ion channel family protein n=1 Tax=Sediminicola sp. YIK13 TaxID=1453352 RepID=UPI00071F951A|nr:mechanosensitive ion channel domain-containing protein [Sediminicola sp. YIK13]ALM07406.1 mechanosensitive ion channel protein MscS [Sediminicola sp. YIK13]
MAQYLKNIPEKLLTSLEENWTMFIKQIPGILIAILIVALGILISKKIGNLSRKVISKRSDDPIMVNFLTKGIKLLLYTIFIMYALEVAGLQSIATGILTAAGASAVIIGFAFRDIGENFISGIILSFNRPFNVNETVSIGEIFGKVKSIEFRYTKLRTFDGRDVYIPNSDVIKKPVYNYTEDGFYRFDFLVGIAYENNIGEAEKLIKQIVKNTKGTYEDDTHRNFIVADELAVNSVNLKVHFWINTFEYGKEALVIKGKVISNVKEALVQEGFSLPANIQELKLYNTQSSIPVSVSHSKIEGEE